MKSYNIYAMSAFFCLCSSPAFANESSNFQVDPPSVFNGVRETNITCQTSRVDEDRILKLMGIVRGKSYLPSGGFLIAEKGTQVYVDGQQLYMATGKYQIIFNPAFGGAVQEIKLIKPDGTSIAAQVAFPGIGFLCLLSFDGMTRASQLNPTM